jgi:hypothetical protein
MLMQVAPRNARPRNPENPIQNKTMAPRATTTARAALNHEWFKAGPFLVAHQTPEHDSFPKSYRESENTPVGNLEVSVRSRGGMVGLGAVRDLIEAGLN